MAPLHPCAGTATGPGVTLSPTAAEPGGPEIDFLTTAPTPGRYLLYLDVKVDGQVHTAPLVVDTAGSRPEGSTATPSASHGDTDHDH